MVVDASCVLDSEVEVAGAEDLDESAKAQYPWYLAIVAVAPLPIGQAEHEGGTRDLQLYLLATGAEYRCQMQGRLYFD